MLDRRRRFKGIIPDYTVKYFYDLPIGKKEKYYDVIFNSGIHFVNFKQRGIYYFDGINYLYSPFHYNKLRFKVVSELVEI